MKFIASSPSLWLTLPLLLATPHDSFLLKQPPKRNTLRHHQGSSARLSATSFDRRNGSSSGSSSFRPFSPRRRRQQDSSTDDDDDYDLNRALENFEKALELEDGGEPDVIAANMDDFLNAVDLLEKAVVETNVKETNNNDKTAVIVDEKGKMSSSLVELDALEATSGSGNVATVLAGSLVGMMLAEIGWIQVPEIANIIPNSPTIPLLIGAALGGGAVCSSMISMLGGSIVGLTLAEIGWIRMIEMVEVIQHVLIASLSIASAFATFSILASSTSSTTDSPNNDGVDKVAKKKAKSSGSLFFARAKTTNNKRQLSLVDNRKNTSNDNPIISVVLDATKKEKIPSKENHQQPRAKKVQKKKSSVWKKKMRHGKNKNVVTRDPSDNNNNAHVKASSFFRQSFDHTASHFTEAMDRTLTNFKKQSRNSSSYCETTTQTTTTSATTTTSSSLLKPRPPITKPPRRLFAMPFAKKGGAFTSGRR